MDREYNASDIRTLDWTEHVKLRPDLYFQKCFSENTLDVLPFEVLCHALDEHYDGKCTEVTLTFWQNKFMVEYNTGMSLNSFGNREITNAEAIMTRMSTCSNLKKHLAVGEEFCEIGMATINAAAENCELTTFSNSKKGHFIFKDGKTISRNLESISEFKSFTKITVKPNKNLFGEIEFTSKGIKEKAHEIQKRLPKLRLDLVNNV